MEFYGNFSPRGGFQGRNLRGCAMRRHSGHPYEFDQFISPMEHPFAFPGWNCPQGMGPWGRGWQRHRREHRHSKENQQNKNQQESSEEKQTDNENIEESENVFTFDKLSSLLKCLDEEGPFEVIVNVRGCDPKKIKVGIKKGVLKVEGRSETPEGGFISVFHEQSIPKEVPASSLKASLYPEGILVVRQEESSLNVPVQIEENQDGSVEEVLEVE